MMTKVVSPLDVCLAYKTVFGTQEGQIVLTDMVRRFGYTRNTTLDSDPNLMVHREGQRSVMVHIGRELDRDPMEFEETNQKEGIT